MFRAIRTHVANENWTAIYNDFESLIQNNKIVGCSKLSDNFGHQQRCNNSELFHQRLYDNHEIYMLPSNNVYQNLKISIAL